MRRAPGGPGAQAVLNRGLRHQLPDALGDAEACLRTDRLWPEVAFLQRDVEELRRHMVLDQRSDDHRGEVLFLGASKGPGQALVRAPLFDVPLHFLDEALRHRYLALAEGACHAENHPVLRQSPVVQYAEFLEQAVVLRGHLGEPRPRLLRLATLGRVRARLHLHLQACQLQLDGLHVVEDLLGHPAGPLELDVLVDADGDRDEEQTDGPGDHGPVASLLAALHRAVSTTNPHRPVAGRRRGLWVEVMRGDFLE
jgi:hypothetical protein